MADFSDFYGVLDDEFVYPNCLDSLPELQQQQSLITFKNDDAAAAPAAAIDESLLQPKSDYDSSKISDDCLSTCSGDPPAAAAAAAEQTPQKKKRKREGSNLPKYAFITRSDKEVIEDGYKWRKYGRKSVKCSPHPRNYYKCSESNCNVKKRVERDPCDESMVITTYQGTHNHESPCIIYYYVH